MSSVSPEYSGEWYFTDKSVGHDDVAVPPRRLRGAPRSPAPRCAPPQGNEHSWHDCRVRIRTVDFSYDGRDDRGRTSPAAMVVGFSPARFRQTSGRATPRAQSSGTRSLACPRSDRPSDRAPDREEPLAEPDRERVLTRTGSAERHPARSRLANQTIKVVPHGGVGRSIANAAVGALRPLGVDVTEMPLTRKRLWR